MTPPSFAGAGIAEWEAVHNWHVIRGSLGEAAGDGIERRSRRCFHRCFRDTVVHAGMPRGWVEEPHQTSDHQPQDGRTPQEKRSQGGARTGRALAGGRLDGASVPAVGEAP